MFNIIIKEFKEFIREKTNLFFFFLFPVALIFLLGNLLGNMDKSEEVVGEIKIQYLIQTEDINQTRAIELFILATNDNRHIIFEEATELKAAKEMAGKDEITAVIVFHGDPLQIDVYEGTNRIKNRTVGAIINGFAQTNSAYAVVMKTIPEALSAGLLPQEEFIVQKDLGVNRSMLDYYAVAMVAMICFFSILQGSVAFVAEREDKTINRLFLAPQNRISIFLQQILGIVPKAILQITVLMLISVYVFHAHYAAELSDNLLLFLLFFVVTLAMVSIGAVIGLVIKTSPMLIVMPPLWIMMAFSGTYSKELVFKGISDLMPIYQIQQAAFDLTVFGRSEKAGCVILICLIILIVMLAVGAFLFSRMEEER